MKRELHWIYGMAFFLAMGIVFLALFAPWIAPYDPTAVSTEEILEGMSSSHWLGTDALGRDILSRTIYGARTSVAFAFVAAFCTMVLGLMLGILSGYFGGWVDRGIQCFVAVFQGLPGMSLMIAVAAILPENNFRLIIALTLTSWAGFSRKYVLPNVLPVVIVLLTLRIGTSLLSASALSYLGLGVSPPTADWGVMISDARTYFRSYPLMMIAPGTGITLFCLSINLLGDAMRERIRR